MRGATEPATLRMVVFRISTHTPHAGRDTFGRRLSIRTEISTHTPHAGRDPLCSWSCRPHRYFNSHAPCGARPAMSGVRLCSFAFQLTRPMRGATSASHHLRPCPYHFNSHAPCGARLVPVARAIKVTIISTHTPHAGRDLYRPIQRHKRQQFQLTRPMRGATGGQFIYVRRYKHFNSHAPCGARHKRP